MRWRDTVSNAWEDSGEKSRIRKWINFDGPSANFLRKIMNQNILKKQALSIKYAKKLKRSKKSAKENKTREKENTTLFEHKTN